MEVGEEPEGSETFHARMTSTTGQHSRTPAWWRCSPDRSGHPAGPQAGKVPGAVYLSASGEHLRGAQIREKFQHLITLQPKLSDEMARHRDQDIALVRNRWDFFGQQPDGTPVRNCSISTVVMRRPATAAGIPIDDQWPDRRTGT